MRVAAPAAYDAATVADLADRAFLEGCGVAAPVVPGFCPGRAPTVEVATRSTHASFFVPFCYR